MASGNNRRAGATRARVTFQKRGDADDGWGKVQPGAGDWEDQFTVWVGLAPMRGTETVMAARLQGQQPYVLTVRQSSQTRQITAAWRAVDARDPKRVFAITAPPADPDGRRAWLEMIVNHGGVS
ncbi:head-tail adaptor protein [Pelagibacterium limicola]|uniref:head-tail adaptor protein n=1 Tax=Pelagibacterium limicola TaxID=2791022 RepID=UPI0018AFE9FA|nr:head-tail adaptor protein [Pelagibacterium limicola]